MPLLKPEIQSALRSVGLAAPEGESVSGLLKSQGSSLEDTLGKLIELAETAGNENVRLRALETTLKLYGVLKEQAPPPPAVTIIIGDGQGLNPILLPRELSAELLKTKESIQ